MSNRDDFDFDDDFLDKDDSGFDFDADDELPVSLDNDFDADMPVIEEPAEDRGGNRTFIVLAILMILLFIGGLALIVFLVTRDTGPTDAELTATQVVMLNMTVEAQLAQTQTRSAEILFMTQTAEAWTDTPTPTSTPTPTPTEEREPTPTPSPTLDATEQAATQFAINFAETATALAAIALLTEQAPPTPDLTLTAQFLAAQATDTPTMQATSPLEAINQTATAIAAAFQTATAQAAGPDVTPEPQEFPTPEILPPTPGFPTIAPTALPETGLFDTIASGGSDGIGLLALAVVGLVGVIFISRRLRTAAPPADELEEIAPASPSERPAPGEAAAPAEDDEETDKA